MSELGKTQLPLLQLIVLAPRGQAFRQDRRKIFVHYEIQCNVSVQKRAGERKYHLCLWMEDMSIV